MTAATGTKLDTRDGKVYRTLLMPDGNWWSAENLAWAGAGLDYGDNPANRTVHGRLYSPSDAVLSVPSGTHCATALEYAALVSSIGSQSAYHLKSASVWAPPGADTYGFGLLPSGIASQISGPGPYYSNLGTWAYLYCGDVPPGVYQYANSNGDLLGPDLAVDAAMSVRFIVESGNIPDTATTPRIYPASGTFQGVQIVTIQGSGVIRYTLDGSEPMTSSPIYTRPICLSTPTTVKARAYATPLESATATAILDIQGASLQRIPNYQDHVLPYLLEQYKGDNA